ncbi:hypothetical protein BRD17_02820 [Halobacteriales archaeon SW_7_68_16]|nr:MAG: hypothetical protein BRD17_02820 [Halobacteriales archaeon SW_7_68_16]
MSNSDVRNDGMTGSTARFRTGLANAATRSHSRVATTIRATGFWLAVALPALHVPLLLSGLGTPSETGAFLALLGLNLLALFVGRSYRTEA